MISTFVAAYNSCIKMHSGRLSYVCERPFVASLLPDLLDLHVYAGPSLQLKVVMYSHRTREQAHPYLKPRPGDRWPHWSVLM